MADRQVHFRAEAPVPSTIEPPVIRRFTRSVIAPGLPGRDCTLGGRYDGR